MAQAVIMAGGQGERFWPMTHSGFPKYCLRFEGKVSLIQKTYQRLRKIYPKNNILVVTTKPHLEFISRELPTISKQNILVEPFRNNTAAAITFSTATIAARHGENEIVSFFPADHLIQDEAAFAKTVGRVVRLAMVKDSLLTSGVKPTFPSTGYGYIQIGDSVKGAPGAHRVSRFVEKPDHKTAQRYLASGKFLWNGGIFTWKPKVFLMELRQHAPKFYKNFNLNKLDSSYRKLENISLDYVLLEKTKNIYVQTALMDWCDIGSWDMFYEKSKKNSESKNFMRGKIFNQNTRNSLLINDSGVPLTVMGLKDVLVVQTSRGTLICPRGYSEEAARLCRAK